MVKRLNGPNRLLHSRLYKLPAQGQPAAVRSSSTHWRNAPLPRHRPVLPTEHGHGKAMLISEHSSDLHPECAAAVESVRTVRSVGVFAGSSRGHWGKEPRHPGQHCNRPEPCSRERGSLLPRQGCLHLNLTDGPGLRLFIQHLREATRRPPQAPGERLPLRSRPGSWAQSFASGAAW